LRKNGFKAPIIMLTGHNTDSDAILGLDSGANDYVTKPFRFAVLLARICAQLRQHETSEDAVLTIGPHAFRPGSKLLLNPKGSKVRLTEKESSILRYLYRAGERPVSREKLLQEVWSYNSGVTTHTLETHIYRLRQKIERDAAAPAILLTEAAATNWCLDRRVVTTSDRWRRTCRRCRPPATGRCLSSKRRVPPLVSTQKLAPQSAFCGVMG
jgi:DNA-binding response OmpR family regulator